MIMARKLSSSFLNSFKKGDLNGVLTAIREDDSLDMQFRGNYVSIYYRGTSILTVAEDGTLSQCDNGYFKRTYISPITPKLSEINNYFMVAKNAIDKFISNIKENTETEVQQQIVRENNYSRVSNDTDYFVIDIEYKTAQGAEFDIVAVKWDALSTQRKNPKDNKLTIFEVKYGNGAIGEGAEGKGAKSATLSAHIKDFNLFISNIKEVNEFKKDMIDVFKQKRELGLIRFKESSTQRKRLETTNNNEITQFAEQIEFGIILCNYNKRSTILKEIGRAHD